MPPPPDLSRHILPASESARIFTSEIAPTDLPPTLIPHPSRTRPLAIFVVGQTGAGKTRFTPAILGALSSSSSSHGPGESGYRPVHLIADVYKAYHPEYFGLLNSAHPEHASPATRPDAQKWLQMACAEAARRKLDVVIESACRDPAVCEELVKTFGSAGTNYRVEVVFLAVPPALSRLGTLTRYHENLPEAASGKLKFARLTPVKIHDESARGLVRVAEWVDSEGGAFVDRVMLARRDGVVAFEYEKVEGEGWKGGCADAVVQERERPLTIEEREIALRDLEKLEGRDAVVAEEVRELLSPLLKDDAVASRESKPKPFDWKGYLEGL